MDRNIVFLILPQAHLLDLAGPAQVFYEASRLGGSTYRISYLSASEEVRLEQGISLAGMLPLSGMSLNAGDFLCIPGIDFTSFRSGRMDTEVDEIADWLLEQRKKGAFLGSICSGALILAKAGLLNHIECTTHWKCISYLKESFPRVKVRDDRLYCFDRNTFTSAGMTAGIDMCLALIEQWDSPLVAARVAQEMVINIRRVDSVEQRNVFLNFKNHFNPDVYRAQEILSAELSVSFTLNDLARKLHMSERHISRLFKKHTGQTIHDYRNRVRVDLGEQLLMYSDKSIKEIAIECGYENSRQFIRLWKKIHGDSPAIFRSRHQKF